MYLACLVQESQILKYELICNVVTNKIQKSVSENKSYKSWFLNFGVDQRVILKKSPDVVRQNINYSE